MNIPMPREFGDFLRYHIVRAGFLENNAVDGSPLRDGSELSHQESRQLPVGK
jgi:hypothetical protein